MKDQKGFTLIEIIAALVIMGFVMLAAGMGFVQAVEAYIFAKENAEISQKTSMALSRMTVELMNCTEIESATSSSIEYYTTAGSLDDEKRTLEFKSSGILLNSYALIDNVAAGSGLSYRKFDNTAWTTGDNFSDLAAIDVVLIINRSSTSTEKYTFNTSITLRNNSVPNAPVPRV